MAAGLSKAARYGRSYRWARSMARHFGGEAKGTRLYGTRADGVRYEAGLQWGNMSNGESVGSVLVFLDDKYQGAFFDTRKAYALIKGEA